LANSSKFTDGRKSYVLVASFASGVAGSGWWCLGKLKRGFEGTGRVVVSFAGVGRKERVSREATLAPLAIL
jgi:hypothetical protein